MPLPLLKKTNPENRTPYQRELIKTYNNLKRYREKTLPLWFIHGLEIHNLINSTHKLDIKKPELYWTSLENIKKSAKTGENLNHPTLPTALHEAFAYIPNHVTLLQCYLTLINHGLSHFTRYLKENQRALTLPYDFIIYGLDYNDSIQTFNLALSLLHFIRSFGYQYRLAHWWPKNKIKKEQESFKTRLLQFGGLPLERENWSLRNSVFRHFLDLQRNQPLSLKESCRNKIRLEIGGQVFKEKVNTLPLPKIFKQYIIGSERLAYRNLEEIEKEFNCDKHSPSCPSNQFLGYGGRLWTSIK